MKVLDYTILTFVVIGAINWGLIGFFDFDLVSTLFGQMSMLTRIIYALVGIGGLYAISYYGRMNSELEAISQKFEVDFVIGISKKKADLTDYLKDLVVVDL